MDNRITYSRPKRDTERRHPPSEPGSTDASRSEEEELHSPESEDEQSSDNPSSSDSSDGDEEYGRRRRKRKRKESGGGVGVVVAILVVVLGLGVVAFVVYEYTQKSGSLLTTSTSTSSTSASSSSSSSSLPISSSSAVDDVPPSSPAAGGGGGSTTSSVTADDPGTQPSNSSSPQANSTQTSTAATVGISTTPATKNTMYLPVDKIRGVNLGSLFIVEPWMAGTQWSNMGCGAYDTEAACFAGLGAEAATAAFVSHWSSWYTADDFTEMASYGLNAVRIPVGYWMVDAIIDGDTFAPGGFKYLKQVCSWAKAAGIYVLIDLHAGPGCQTSQAFAGIEGAVNFYQDSNYERAYKFFTNITTEVHSDDDFSTVFAVEAINEPETGSDQLSSLVGTYYPGVEKAVRDAEAALGISCDDTSFKCLNIMYMSIGWNGGTDPDTNLNASDTHLVYGQFVSAQTSRFAPTYFSSKYFPYISSNSDSHPYFHWAGIDNTRAAHMSLACSMISASADTPLVAGEWSISPVDDTGEMAADSSGAAAYYTQLSSAAMSTYEKNVAGWMFWSWKTDLGAPFWDYQYGVVNGFIPKTLTNLDDSGCS